MITRDEFLSLAGAEDVRSVFVPAFDRDVFYRLIDADEMDRYQMRMANYAKADKGDYNMRGNLMAMCVCDENGKRIFKDADAEKLRKMKMNHIEPLIDAIMEANGMTPSAKENAEKNSVAILSENGGSGLHNTSLIPPFEIVSDP